MSSRLHSLDADIGGRVARVAAGTVMSYSPLAMLLASVPELRDACELSKCTAYGARDISTVTVSPVLCGKLNGSLRVITGPP